MLAAVPALPVDYFTVTSAVPASAVSTRWNPTLRRSPSVPVPAQRLHSVPPRQPRSATRRSSSTRPCAARCVRSALPQSDAVGCCSRTPRTWLPLRASVLLGCYQLSRTRGASRTHTHRLLRPAALPFAYTGLHTAPSITPIMLGAVAGRTMSNLLAIAPGPDAYRHKESNLAPALCKRAALPLSYSGSAVTQLAKGR